jgi:hypothetical protein
MGQMIVSMYVCACVYVCVCEDVYVYLRVGLKSV